MKRGIEAFFKYARARHTVYLCRREGRPRNVWTKDKILQQYRFTNVFRELDKTTMWFADHVREPMRDKPEVLLATVIFRLLNRISTGEAIFNQADIEFESAFWQFVETGKVACLKRAIVANCGKGPYVTGAYIISSPPGYTKLDGMMEIIRRFNSESGWREWQDVHDEVSLEIVWGWLKQFDYFGPFHSYEMVTDLRFTKLLENAPDIMTWANPGPGAHRGANRVFRGDKDAKVSRDQVIEEMQALLLSSLNPDCWPQGKTGADNLWRYDHQWPSWELRDVEHTLCEFDKYERVRLGEGRPRGVYR